MDIALVEGRLFQPTDAQGSPGVVLINQAMKNLFWPDRSPVGQRIKAPGDDNPWLTIVGVVGDVKQGGLDKKTGTEVYFLHDQAQEAVGGMPDTMYLTLRTQNDPLSLVSAVRAEVRRLDPALPLADVRTMNQVVYSSVGEPRFLAFLVMVFAVVALALAAVGTYGVLAYMVEQRTQEIGVRMALGAQASQVLSMVLGQGAWLVGLGLLLGVGGALAMRRVLASVLFGVVPTDPAILGTVLLILSAVGFLACYLPARRAMRVNPLLAMRSE
jgi:putative ABC transport system permease protein